MIEQIQPRDFGAWVASARAQGMQPLLLDVREPLEWQLASVRPADVQVRQLPMHEIPHRLNTLDEERPTAVLCHHGGRSMQVAMFLLHHGFERVANVLGGIDAWAAQFDPTVPRY